jgi:hypothetical protein
VTSSPGNLVSLTVRGWFIVVGGCWLVRGESVVLQGEQNLVCLCLGYEYRLKREVEDLQHSLQVLHTLRERRREKWREVERRRKRGQRR